MNKKKLTCVVVMAMVLLLGTALPGYTWGGSRSHHGFHGHRPFVGTRVFIGPIWWGSPFWWGPPYPYPYAYPYYALPPVIVQQAPPVYIQQEPQPSPQAYWYYCPNPQGYYPYIKECPQGWMTVVPPSPPPGR